MKPTVDELLAKAQKWQPEMAKLRSIMQGFELCEEVKWYQPCYSYAGKNLFILGSFKGFCTLSFLKGVLLKDPEKILTFPGENSQSAKLVKFTNLQQIIDLEVVLKDYIKEGIALEKAGAKVAFKKIEQHPTLEELEDFFEKNPDFKRAFKALTPGRQRAYMLHFSSAKQSTTKIARIEKYIPKILEGKGIND